MMMCHLQERGKRKEERGKRVKLRWCRRFTEG